MSETEKARVNGPIPNAVVYHDATESIALQIQLQVSLLIQRAGVDAGTVVTLAPMVFGVLA